MCLAVVEEAQKNGQGSTQIFITHKLGKAEWILGGNTQLCLCEQQARPPNAI